MNSDAETERFYIKGFEIMQEFEVYFPIYNLSNVIKNYKKQISKKSNIKLSALHNKVFKSRELKYKIWNKKK